MDKQPVTIERLFKASVSTVWKALTDKDEMKIWYFDLPEFKPEPGFTFQFYGGRDPENPYLHLCEITEAVAEKKLTYSWRYDGYPGISFVHFELFEQGDKTRLKLTHEGIETFGENPDLAKERFEEGWTAIVNTSLKDYLEPVDS